MATTLSTSNHSPSSYDYDSSPPLSSPDYNDSPPYNQPAIKQAQRLIPFNGWLSMAPQVDNSTPVKPAEVDQAQVESNPPSSTSTTTFNHNNQQQQQSKPVGYSYKPPTPRKAVFSVGTDDSEDETMEIESPVIGENNIHNFSNSSRRNGTAAADSMDGNQDLASVSSLVQVSYPGSQQPPASLAFLSNNPETGDDGTQRIVAPASSHPLNRSYSNESDPSTTYDDSPPEFDVRSSFAPMPKYGVGVGLTFQSLAPQTSDELDNVSNTSTTGLHSNSTAQQKSSKKSKASSNYEVGPGGFIKINGGGGLFHGKREYKGLTAHAVELEMEEMGDESVMSHAPDPVYLASRLEMLRRNLEEEDKSPGGRRGGWVEWVGDFEKEEEEKDVEMIDDFKSSSNIEIKINDEDLSQVERKKKEEEDKEEERRLKKLPASPAPTAASNPFLGASGGSEISSTLPSNSTFNKISAMRPIMERTFTSDSIASIIPPSPSKEAKMKALDERLEIRNIKRTDLEQVRELHCYHGDGDKHDTETYTTSAPFLLRLLVDEKHVCLVAVERPLPEPVALPNREDLSNSISSLDQRLPLDFQIAADSSPESLPSPISSPGDSRSQQVPELNLESEASPSLTPASIEPSSGSSSSFSATDSRFSFLRSNGHTQGISHYNPRSNRHQNFVGGLSGIKESHLSGLARSEFTTATSTDDIGAPTTKSMATVRDPAEIQMNLVGPTHDEDIAPVRTIKVMGLPPPGGLRATSEAETVLAVASATIGIKENNENMWASHLDENVKEFEAHILTLSIAPAERSQGLGKKMLETLMEECKRRANEASSRASSSNRSGGSKSSEKTTSQTKMRTYLEVHASNTKAINLYKEVGFKQMEGNEGLRRNFFRGDNRIPMRERMRKGGQDAILMEIVE